MAFKGRGKAEPDLDKLKASLVNSGEQTKNNALFQTIFQLIDGSKSLKETLSGKIGKTDKIDLDNQVDGHLPVKKGGSYSDIYLPILTLVANLSGVGTDDLHFYQNGDIITVAGRIQVTPTAVGVLTRAGISLPLISYFKFPYQCAGSAGSPTVNQAGAIIGDVLNNRAELQFLSVNNITYDMFFTFAYRIIQQ